MKKASIALGAVLGINIAILGLFVLVLRLLLPKGKGLDFYIPKVSNDFNMPRADKNIYIPRLWRRQ